MTELDPEARGSCCRKGIPKKENGIPRGLGTQYSYIAAWQLTERQPSSIEIDKLCTDLSEVSAVLCYPRKCHTVALVVLMFGSF